MKSRLIITTLVALTLFAGNTSNHVLAAGPTGKYDIFTFLGASATNCGTWFLGSTAGVNQPGPSNYTQTITDGKGNVVFSLSQSGGIGFFTFWFGGGLPFTVQPQANPIHVHVVMDGVVVADVSADDPCLGGSGPPGPPIPAGFVLRTITCDVAVFETAGGIPVPSGEHILNGQTWYVNPKPVTDSKGKSWTEIFDAGYINGFIPTSCVGGKPAGYAGA